MAEGNNHQSGHVSGRFSEYPDLLRELVNLFTEKNKIAEIIRAEGEKQVLLTEDNKNAGYDVYAVDRHGSQVALGMLCYRENDLGGRINQYIYPLLFRQLKRGEKYTQTRSVVLLVFHTKNLFHSDNLITRLRLTDTENRINVNNRTEVIFVNLHSRKLTDNKAQNNVVRYMQCAEVSDTFTEQLEKAVKEIRNRPEWEEEFMTLEDIRYYEHRDGVIEGKNIGYRRGKKEGIRRGKEEGVRQNLQKRYRIILKSGKPRDEAVRQIAMEYEISFEEAEKILFGGNGTL